MCRRKLRGSGGTTQPLQSRSGYSLLHELHTVRITSQELPSQWRHNERDGVSNHRRLDCLLNRLFWRRAKKTSKLRVTDLCEGNSPVNSPHKGPVNGKCFHLMTSSWRPRFLFVVLCCGQFPENVASTVRCRYNAVNFLQNTHNRHPIARPWGRDMGCLLWIQTLITVLHQSL